MVLGVGHQRVRNIASGVAQGRPAPAPDQRCQNQGRRRQASAHVDSFLEYCYQNLAESLAEGVNREDMREFQEGIALPDDVGSDGSAGEIEEISPLVTEDHKKNPKFLPPGSVQELYETHRAFSDDIAQIASYNTFRRGLKQWRQVLKFRAVSQHAKCSICAKLSKLRSDATTDAERKDVQDQLTGAPMNLLLWANYMPVGVGLFEGAWKTHIRI